MRRTPGEAVGVLVVDKPVGPTSHDVVAQARRLYRTRAVGHAGTLDPLASGVEVLLFGEATKLSAHLTLAAKRYRATVTFGASTDTLDSEGQVTEEIQLATDWLAMDRLEAALAKERQRCEQIPPAFSAIKIDGERAHRISRRGGSVEIAPRQVEVLNLELISLTQREIVVEMTVSKGYYVRAFARDLAARLEVPGHLAALRRLASGCFTIAEAHPWPPPTPVPLTSIADAVKRAMPTARLTPVGTHKARLGQRLTSDDFAPPSPGAPSWSEAPPSPNSPVSPVEAVMAWLDEGGDIVALGTKRAEGNFAVVRGFSSPTR